MSSAVIQLLVLAGIAIFLILRLRNVLGSREGFEKPQAPVPLPDAARARRGSRAGRIATSPTTRPKAATRRARWPR
jgi:hypothetical protein